MRRRGAVKWPVSITVLTAMAVVAGSVSVPGLQAAARAAGSGGNASLSLSKTVTGASFAPTLLASLSADRTAVIPGDQVTYTAHLTNAGAVLTVTGSISAQDGNDASASVVDWYDEIEFHNKATNAWMPIGGYQATQAGWTPVNPSPVTTGLAVTMTPAAATGVTYPSSGDRVLGTQIGAGATARWDYSVALTVPASVVQVLSDPNQVSGIRNVLHMEATPRSAGGQPFLVRTEFTNPFSAASAALTSARVVFTLPDGSSRTVDSSGVPALASIAPGQAVDVPVTWPVPVPAPPGANESDAAYLSRLGALEGSALTAQAHAAATSNGIPVTADAPPVTTVEHLPVVSIGKTGPATLDVGTSGHYTLALTNSGGTVADGIALTDTVPSGSHGTLSGVPASIAAMTSASAAADFPVPQDQPDGPLTDTAQVTWADANGNPYGPVSASFTTTIQSSLTGATLMLSPATAGPDIIGTDQALTVSLFDRSNAPVPNAVVTVTVTGANPVTSTVTTGADGTAVFHYSGTGPGLDTAQATVVSGTTHLASNTSQIGWISPIAPVSSTPVTGNFYAEPASAQTFVAQPTDAPAFGQTFPSITFNPSATALPHNVTGVGPGTHPFTDVTTDVEGNGTGTIVAQGNGVQAGVAPMTSFDAVFTANLVVAKPGDVTFQFDYDAGFMFGVGGGASRVSGIYVGPPASNTSPFQGYPLVGADNTASSAVRTSFVTVHFPAAGSYPYEVDYTGPPGPALSLVMSTATVTQDQSGLNVYAGYADGLRPGGSVFPFPWEGSPNTVFVGCPGSCVFDAGAIRLDNTTGRAVTVNSLTVDFGANCRFAIWPSGVSLPNGQSALFTQTISGASSGCPADGTFDTSDAPLITCNPTHIIPHITFVIDGVTHEFDDTQQILNTKGIDPAICSFRNESQPWTRLGGSGTPVNTPLPPAGSITLSPLGGTATVTSVQAAVGTAQSFRVAVMDASGLPVAGAPVNLTITGANPGHVLGTTGADGTAVLTYNAPSAGDDMLQASSFITGLQALSGILTVHWSLPPGTVPDPNNPGQTLPAQPPVISAQSPADGTRVTAPVPVTADITPPAGETITSWKVTYQAASPGSPLVTLASGTGSPPTTLARSGGDPPPTSATLDAFDPTVLPDNTGGTGGTGGTGDSSGTAATLATFDPTVLPNDTYTITVSATSSGGGIQSASTTVAVAGALKLGRYVTTYDDLSVPVNGFQMTVDRTYDSIDKRVGDFGVGWRVSLGNFRVTANRALGAGGWTEYPTSCTVLGCLWAFKSSVPHYVTVTFPDQHQEVFDFTPTAGASVFNFLGTAQFTARPGTGTTSTLEVLDSSIRYDFAGNITTDSGSLYAPTRFKLTTIDGQVLILDTTTGLVSETDRNGNSLSVDANGVHSSSGASLIFTRDGQGRITDITGPDGEHLSYAYTSAGDLGTFTDADGKVTSYTYDGDHNLTQVTGPDNTRTSTITYDADGRIASITDADGHTVTLASDVAARQETISNANGTLTTVLSYDDLGDVIRRDDIAGGQTRTTLMTYDAIGHRTGITTPDGAHTAATYDANGNLTSITTPGGLTTTITYGPAANPLTASDTLGHTASFSYDQNFQITSFTDPAGGTVSYEYDANGNVTAAVDQNGARSSYTYDSRGRMATATDALGDTTSYTYTDTGNLASVTDPLGRTTTYTYDPVGRLLTEQDPLGHTTTYAYDALGRPSSVTDPLGRVTSYTYTPASYLASVTDPAGMVTRYTYDQVGMVTSSDRAGAVTQYVHNGFGDLTSYTDPVGRVTTFGWDALDRMTSMTLPNGGQWTYSYNADGQQTSVTDPLGQQTVSSYDTAGLVTSQTDPAGNTTRYGYDALGRLITVTDPLGRVTRTAYDPAGRVISTTDPAGGITQYGYDAAGRQTSVTDPTGRTTTNVYDAAGQLTGVIDPAGNTSTNTYDAAGRLTETTSAAGIGVKYAYDAAGQLTSVTDALGNATTYAYDPDGRISTATDPQGHATSFGYDPAGNLTTVTDALGGIVRFGYDAAGQRTSQTDPDGHVTTTSYDQLGNVASVTSAATGTVSYVYDAAGRLSSRTAADGQVTSYTYDPRSLLTGMTSPDGAITFSYDADGRRTSMTDPTGTTTFSYGAAGNLTEVAAPEGTVRYGYDAAGRRTSITMPGDRTATYAYDAAGMLASVTDWAGQSTTYTHDADGRITGVSRPNGVATSYGYDPAGRLTSVTDALGGTNLEQFNYTLDAMGRRTAVSSNAGQDQYKYDALGRLVSASYADGTSEAFTYDAAGNRTSATQNGQTTTYTYDDAGRLTSVGGVALSYDANGAVTAFGDNHFGYDAQGHLTSAQVGGTTHTYSYDGDGLRVSASTGTSKASYMWDRAAGTPRLLSDGTTDILYGDGIAAEYTGGTASYPLTDGLGSVRAITDANGAITAQADYTAFGTTSAASGSIGPLGFAGELTDVTGLIDLQARSYDPSLGRFTSADSQLIGGPGTQGLNRYAYALSDPVDITDPTGNQALVEYEEEQTTVDTVAQKTLGELAKELAQELAERILEKVLELLFHEIVDQLVKLATCAIVSCAVIQPTLPFPPTKPKPAPNPPNVPENRDKCEAQRAYETSWPNLLRMGGFAERINDYNGLPPGKYQSVAILDVCEIGTGLLDYYVGGQPDLNPGQIMFALIFSGPELNTSPGRVRLAFSSDHAEVKVVNQAQEDAATLPVGPLKPMALAVNNIICSNTPDNCQIFLTGQGATLRTAGFETGPRYAVWINPIPTVWS